MSPLQHRLSIVRIPATALLALGCLQCGQDRPLTAQAQPGIWNDAAAYGKRLIDELIAVLPPPEPALEEPATPGTLQEQRAQLFARMQERLKLSDDTMAKVKAVFSGSKLLSQGNPAVATHPMDRTECRKIRSEAKLPYYVKNPVCGELNMVPIYNPAAGETERDAKVCIDQYEFPNYPCEYPVVFAKAREAVLLCEALGKRLCDAHEWEGACAGAVRPAETEYAWGKSRMEMKWKARNGREVVWAYGKTKDHSKCATGSRKNDGCGGGGWKTCGSNTYPTGAFPECVSPFGVFDQHGNAAEHMNLPMNASELASKGKYGETEMKGSWFIFSRTEAHEDDCRWRAPDWHVSKVMSEESHYNYHLSFRCCKDVQKP